MDKKVMELWGAEEFYFAEPEICIVFNWQTCELTDFLEDFKQREPEMYEHFRTCRRTNRDQNKFEKHIRPLTGDYLDREFQWNREQEFINNNGTNDLDYWRKHDEDQKHKGQY